MLQIGRCRQSRGDSRCWSNGRWWVGRATIYVPAFAAIRLAGYLIIYRANGPDVLILHIIHASRDLDAVLRGSDP